MRRGPAQLAALGLALACAGPGFDYGELPGEPIALVYRTRQEAERVLEMIDQQTRGPLGSTPGEYTVRLEDVQDAFGLGRSKEQRAADLLGRLAFLDVGTREVRIADFANRGSRPLDWTPERDRLLYLAFPRLEAQVFEYELETGQVRAVTQGPEEHLDACYGPDGRIAVTRAVPRAQAEDEGGARIWVRDPGGGAPRPVTPGPADHRPAWSPDGAVLVYESIGRDGRSTIRAVDPSGSGEPRLLGRGSGPVFTPDGAWIVYSAPTRQGQRIWKMRPDGSGKHPVGRSAYEERDPAVSPDGRFVVFVTTRDDRHHLMVRTLEGRGDRPLLLEGDGLHPTW